jgi:hypothetical protein
MGKGGSVAFARVAGNKGTRTPASEGVTASYVKREAGVPRFLDDLRATLKDGSFQPLPVRERMIPKPGVPGSCGCCVTAVGLVFLAGAGSDVSSDHVNLYGDLRVTRSEVYYRDLRSSGRDGSADVRPWPTAWPP